MPRPRKGTEEVWYDTFAQWPEADRAVALKVLEQLHRALAREARRKPADKSAESLPLEEGLHVE